MQNDTSLPRARTENLVLQNIQDETLVYDKQTHRAHCLNSLASLVWRHCDGTRNVTQLASIVDRHTSTTAGPELVGITLQELREANLLEGGSDSAPNAVKYSRRQLLSKYGTSTAAGLLLAPLVTSIMTQTAMAQASPRVTTTASGPGTTSIPTTPPPTTVGP